jgi:TonB-linked SusC/RagA family outer membrane protein
MKATSKILFLLVFCLPGFAQELHEIKVTCGVDHQEMRVLFRQIREQTGLQFAFQPSAVDPYNDVTLPKETRTVKETLDLAFAGTKLSYKKQDKTVMVFENEGSSSSNPPDQNQSSGGALHYVSGKVTDSKGGAIPGVNILIRGTSEGTVSDAEGKYSLQVTGSDLLLFSFIGFKKFETEVGERTIIDVTLDEETATLNAVTINAGYYETTDMMKTGSIVKVTAKDIERQPVTSPLMALQGRMPGVDITPNNGTAGSAVKVVIRGQNSISNTNATPLYIIDGIQVDSRPIQSTNSDALGSQGFDPLSTLNPANIESFEVLKDADATAIYGSRGANGVILITTKKGGTSEKTNFDVSAYTGIAQTPQFIDLLSTAEYVQIRKEAFSNSKMAITPQTAPDLAVWDTTRYTDWQKFFLGNPAKVSDVQLNISSGTKTTSFRFGGGYHREDMTAPGDFGFRRLSANLNVNHTSTNQKFRASVTMNYGHETNKLFTGGSLVNTALTLAPNAPALYDSIGNLNWERSTFNNPLAALRKTDTNTGNNLILNTNLNYQIAPGFLVSANFGYNSTDRSSIAKYPFSAMNPATITSKTFASSTFGLTRRDSWILEPQLVYRKEFQQHGLNVVIGSTIQESNSAYQLVQATGYTSDVLLESLKGATQTSYVNDENSQYRYMALFGRIGYDFNHKYLVNLTGRRDGSSRFGPENRWGNFGASGAAWIFSEEKFMRRFSFLSFGKLRSSYGVTGSDQLGDYKYLSTYKYTSYPYSGAVSLVPTGLTNKEYAWEETWKFEAALELGFAKDRIRVETAFYQNLCSNQLLNYQLPGISGFTGVTQNLNATVQNTGVEFALNTLNISTSSFNWASSVNFTIPRNMLLSYPGLQQSTDVNRYVVGQPLTIEKLYRYGGVNPTTGLYQVKDIDGNGVLAESISDYGDRSYVQNIGRTFYGGINNTFRFKGFELSFLVQFSTQTSYNFIFYNPGFSDENIPERIVQNHWRKDGDQSMYQKASRDFAAYYAQAQANVSDASYLSSSFLRIKTASLSYVIPHDLVNKLSLKSGKIFVQGQNLATFSAFNGLDPEIGINTLPPLRIITMGIEIRL